MINSFEQKCCLFYRTITILRTATDPAYVFTLQRKALFQKLLDDMKAFPESIRNKLPQRTKSLIDAFREQVIILNSIPTHF